MSSPNTFVVADTPDSIAMFQLLARRGALHLECLGMKRRGRSAYSICKQVYGLKGSKQSVLAQLNAMVDAILHRASDDARASDSEQS